MSKNDPYSIDQLQKMVENFSDLLASAIVDKLKPELRRIMVEALSGSNGGGSQVPLGQPIPHKTLWSMSELAADSGLSKGTWYKWVNQRKIPFVRLGRALRIRDSDYRKLIQKSFRPEFRWKGSANE